MATWTALGRSSWFGDAFACDLGPYIGPDVLTVDYLPAGCGELDYYVAAGTDAAALFTGDGNVGNLADAFRYGTFGSTQYSYPASLADRGVDPDGAHLYVVWYPVDFRDLSTPPAPKPEQVVPCLYVRGGRGPYFGPAVVTPGRWSDWQPGQVSPTAMQGGGNINAWVTGSAGRELTWNSATNGPDPIPFDQGDAAALGLAAVADARANLAAGVIDPYAYGSGRTDYGCQFIVDREGEGSYRHYSFDSRAYYSTSATASFLQSTYTFRPAINAPSDLTSTRPAGLNALRQGVDYATPPGGGNPWQWESPSVTVDPITLPSVTFTDHPTHYNITADNSWFVYTYGTANGYNGLDLDQHVIFDIYAIPRSVETYYPSPAVGTRNWHWTSHGDGVHVGTIDYPIRTVGSVPQYADADGATVTLDFSALGPVREFSVVFEPRAVRQGGSELFGSLPDFLFDTHEGSYAYYDYGIHAWYSYVYSIFPSLFAADGVALDGLSWIHDRSMTMRYPRWRYWIPPVTTPGPLQCCPSQKLQLSTASRDWSDWQDPGTVQLTAPYNEQFETDVNDQTQPHGIRLIMAHTATADVDTEYAALVANTFTSVDNRPMIDRSAGQYGVSMNDSGGYYGLFGFSLLNDHSRVWGMCLGVDAAALETVAGAANYGYDFTSSDIVEYETDHLVHVGWRTQANWTYYGEAAWSAVDTPPPMFDSYIDVLDPAVWLGLLNGQTDYPISGGPGILASTRQGSNIFDGYNFPLAIPATVKKPLIWIRPALTAPRAGALAQARTWGGIYTPAAIFQKPRFRTRPGAVLSCSGLPPYLRMTQRNDGLGISPSPALGHRSTSVNAPGHSPRIGRANRYL